MDFGYSTGDFLALLQLANKLRKRFEDAPTQHKEVSNDVKKLSNVLRVIEDYEPERNLSGPQIGSLQMLSQGCREVLEKLRGSLEKYSYVMSVDQSAKSSIQRTWKKVTWNPKEAIYFHEKIDSEINHFSLFLAESTLQVVRETRSMVTSCTNGVNKIIEECDDKKRLKMLNWLSSNNSELKHARIWSDRQENTGQWLLESDEFIQWLAQDCDKPQERRTLFCHGDEGAGKTFISAIVVEKLRQRFESDGTVGIAFFYCDFHEKPTVDMILASLLKQLLQESTAQLGGLKILYDALKKKQRRPTEGQILELLDPAISSLSRVFFVIDALDECRHSDGFEEMLRGFSSLEKWHNLGLFVTSRSLPVITEHFQGNPWMRIYAHDEDISGYLRSRLRGFRAVRNTPELLSEVISTIIKSADGMFLLVGLQLESLQGYEVATAKSIRDKLKVLPTSLESAYRQTMKRIKSQAEIQTKIARLVLAWVVWATRPLRSLELQHAVAAAFEEDSFDECNLWRIGDIVSICAGIITVDEQSDIVQLRHYTRYEFLKNHWSEFFPDPHIQLTTICIAYMRHEALQDGNTASHSQFMGYLERFPLFEYSAKHWGFHARMSYSSVKEQVLTFVQSEKYLPRSLQVLFSDRCFSQTRQGCSITVSPLHPAAYFGLEECLLHFLGNNLVTRNMKDDCGQTALHWAVINGQVEAAELLLNHALEVNSADKEGKTALHYAASQDDSRLVKLLIHYKADLEYTDMDGQTPLLTAVQNMKLEPAQELVGLGASIKATDSMYRSALHLSALAGNRSVHITKFLLAKGACSESCDAQNMTAMHYAILQGPEDAVEALIKAGACADAGIVRKRWKRTEKSGKWHYDISPGDQKATGTRTFDGLTPLHWAALIGHRSMVKYLLSKGADPNKRCQDGDAPLHLAIRADIIRDYDDAWNSPSWRIEILTDLAEAGSEEYDDAYCRVSEIRSAIIEVLLSHPSINVDIQNEQLQTPLHLAACVNDDSMNPFSVLMSKEPDTSICNDQGQTPLHLASAAGKVEMVKHLLAARASVDVLDYKGLSPLQYSVRLGKSAAVVKILLECYDMTQVNPCTQRDRAGRNLLHHYLQTDDPSEEVVLTLLNYGANVNEIDTEGDSPLSLCLRTSNLTFNRASICYFLLKNGASASWTDDSGRNLAHISMLAYPWNPVDKVLSILTDFGVDIAAKDSYNRGILHHGAKNGSVTQGVIDLLKRRGSLSLHERDKDDRTPLSYAKAKAYLDKGFGRNQRKLTLDVLLKANED